ncbi:MAG TPA: DJ-1/PfpI family protein [Kiloniellaceae bacterium]|nr:DJ-1/PfpI family protein [Kiloniellaceae bacterium]HIP77862.1 DJ-1/PfpI family protein [Kiloniellaceae bacterium]
MPHDLELQDERRPLSGQTPLSIVVLLYPGCTLLDLAGPEAVLAALPGARVYACWKETGPVPTDGSLTLLANCTLEDAPQEPDVLFVPGGAEGTIALLNDTTVLGWLRSRGAGAAWITSVCSGSLVLAAAGLLQGRRATSHWVVRDALALFGATPVAERVVQDGPIMTGGGVTAGIDFGLQLAARLSSQGAARGIQLALEYAPAPPFTSGTPESAGPALTAEVAATFDVAGAEPAIARAARRLLGAADPGHAEHGQ